MLTSLDDSVGSIIESLDNNGMLEDSIVLFIADNGAPADDPIWGYGNSGSNWPLRGVRLIKISQNGLFQKHYLAILV